MKYSLTQSRFIVAQAPVPESLPETKMSVDLWMIASGLLLALLIAGGIFAQRQINELRKQLKFTEYKNNELQKRVKMALGTITKMEKNPDLIHSREFNLDYLRLRMDEELFHFQIVNQLKVKVKQQLAIALRPRQAEAGMIGVSSKARQIDQIFDVVYKTSEALGSKTRVLFRIEIKLAKIPTQSTSSTINQIIECIETFLSPKAEGSTWQPTIQGRLANMHWDQKAKPTPLLVLEQSAEGVNVTLRSKYKPA
ncbi:hypothetical protein PN498_25675 [Oscillatoria sp. CS-180]|uniref:hypothetical protein n=1 Tax=Oscillatoria sp. CS-180 TaxID=3021720 RepID=UPI00232E7AC5|nr:hypothetical protein [Oscillatoria sp. CS-180]MDB9529407.1 hypothetical protein [Oscillatoria sp. CS-180]